MGVVGARRIGQTSTSQIAKAEDLLSLVSDIVSKITEIDDDIRMLVQGGIEGETVDPMVASYKQNREVIDDFVRRFSLTASVVKQNAELTMEKQAEAIEAIQSGQII